MANQKPNQNPSWLSEVKDDAVRTNVNISFILTPKNLLF